MKKKIEPESQNILKNVIGIFKIFFRSNKIYAFLIIVLTVVTGIIPVIHMILGKRFLDSVLEAIRSKGDMEMIKIALFWIGMQLLLLFINNITNIASEFFNDMHKKLIQKEVSIEIIRKADELDLSYYENPEFYNKLTKANEQSQNRIMKLIFVLINLIKHIITFIGSFIILINFSSLILLIVILASIPRFLIEIKYSKWIYKIYENRVPEGRELNYLKDAMTNYMFVKEVKLFNLGKYFLKLISSLFDKHYLEDKKISVKRNTAQILIGIFSLVVASSFRIFVVIKTILDGQTIGTMTMNMSAIERVEGGIRELMKTLQEIYDNNLYINNLFEYLKLKPIISKNGKLPYFSGKINNAIEFRNVSFKYPGTENYVIKNLNMELPAKSNFAIVGLNGSGKTTLVKLLSRLYDPTEGEIVIDGINIRNYDYESYQKAVSVIFQDYVRWHFSIQKNIGLGRIQDIDKLDKIIEAAKKADAHNFIQNFENGYDTNLMKLKNDGIDISIGQWQRLALSRAFLRNAPITILDEPTASLDAQTEYEIFCNFKELIKEKTTVLISHRFSTTKMADHIYVMDKGKIIEKGSHDELLEINGQYASLFNKQAAAYK